jgi:hypothetical protein
MRFELSVTLSGSWRSRWMALWDRPWAGGVLCAADALATDAHGYVSTRRDCLDKLRRGLFYFPLACRFLLHRIVVYFD